MANCENIPTLQTVQDFNTNAQVFNEVVTSDLDETTLEDSEGNKHLTLVGMAKEMDGLQGPVGPTPPHEWDGTNLRFAQAVHWDSTLMEYVVDEWGNYEDLVGPIGPQGIQGVQGVVGPTPIHEWDGASLRFAISMHWDEDSSSYVVDEWGNFEDLTGPQGPQGIQGIQGVQGERGDDGSSFAVDEVGDYAELTNYDDELKGFSFLAQDYTTPPHTAPGTIFFKMSDTSGDWSDPIPFGKGPQGDQGEQGVQGIQGEQGPQGERGPDGEKGVQGDPGIQGIQGEKGDQGDRGPQGEKGVQGDQGIQGIQGEQGPVGEKGPTGDKGADGSDGADGKSARGFVTADEYLSTGLLDNALSSTVTVTLASSGYITVLIPILIRATRQGLVDGETAFGVDLIKTECRAKVDDSSIVITNPSMINIRAEGVVGAATTNTTISGVSSLLAAGTYEVTVSLEATGGTVSDNNFLIGLYQATVLASPA
ncbi:hypothetical protein [Vibrio parahaemolyticus]|uniref:hypothetical protein n=1 Tax=Vibrio parahaemolyticus TaxID=670 RepID=UPI0030047386